MRDQYVPHRARRVREGKDALLGLFPGRHIASMKEIQGFLDRELREGGGEELAAALKFGEQFSIVGFVVGDVASATAGNEKFFPKTCILFDKDDTRARLRGAAGSHHAGGASAHHSHVPHLRLLIHVAHPSIYRNSALLLNENDP